jgi:hypothetical protein
VEDQYAYLSTEDDRLEIVDVSSSPLLVDTYDDLDNPGDLLVKDEHLYLCDTRSFKILQFIPLSDRPEVRPERIQSVKTSPSKIKSAR